MLEPVALERAVRHADDAYRDRVDSAWTAAELRRHLSGTITALHLVVGGTVSMNATGANAPDDIAALATTIS